VIKTAINVSEFVQILGMLETLGTVLEVDVAEDDARGRESGGCFTGEIGTYDRLLANKTYYTLKTKIVDKIFSSMSNKFFN